MADFKIKPTSGTGNKLILESQDGTDVLTTSDSGVTINSPTLVTPALGTPASGVLTNLTGLVEGAMPSKSVIAVTSFTNSTRQALADSANYWLSYGTVVKKSATSKLVCTESTSGHQNYSGSSGVGVRIGDVYRYGAMTYESGGNQKQYTQTHDFGDMGGAGSFTVYWGWKTADGSTGNKPFMVLNPNSTEDDRNPQTSTSIIVWEVQA